MSGSEGHNDNAILFEADEFDSESDNDDEINFKANEYKTKYQKLRQQLFGKSSNVHQLNDINVNELSKTEKKALHSNLTKNSIENTELFFEDEIDDRVEKLLYDKSLTKIDDLNTKLENQKAIEEKKYYCVVHHYEELLQKAQSLNDQIHRDNSSMLNSLTNIKKQVKDLQNAIQSDLTEDFNNLMSNLSVAVPSNLAVELPPSEAGDSLKNHIDSLVNDANSVKTKKDNANLKTLMTKNVHF